MANYVDGSDSGAYSDSEPGTSSSAMPRSNYGGDVVPADGICDGGDKPDGDYEPHRDFEP